MKKLLYLTGLLCCLHCSLWAQDPVFSQFFSAPMQLNPALTGLSDAPTIYLNYRNQWSKINQAYATYSAAYSQFSPKLRSGFGINALADVQGNGIYTTSQFNFSYAYDIRFDENFYIRTGLEFGFVSKRLNWDKLIFLDQLDPTIGLSNPTNEAMVQQSINYFDAGFGMVLHWNNIHGGVSFKHINQPNEAFYQMQISDGQLPVRTTLHAGAQIPIGAHNKGKNNTFISPNLLFVKQRQFHQLNFGAYAQVQDFFGGLFFRHAFGNSDALIMTLGLSKGVFKVAYSYDVTVSGLGPNTGGSHEVALILNFEDKNKKHKQRYNDCLKIFR